MVKFVHVFNILANFGVDYRLFFHHFNLRFILRPCIQEFLLHFLELRFEVINLDTQAEFHIEHAPVKRFIQFFSRYLLTFLKHWPILLHLFQVHLVHLPRLEPFFLVYLSISSFKGCENSFYFFFLNLVLFAHHVES